MRSAQPGVVVSGSQLRFLVLGTIRTIDANGLTVPAGERKVNTLLAVLLANANARVSAETLTRTLWGAQPPRSAVANLHTYVWKLRHRLPDRDRLRLDSSGYRLTVAPGELDASAVTELAAAGRRRLDAGDVEAAAGTLAAAAALCRGEPFEGVDEVANEPQVLRLREVYRTLREDLAEARLLLGQHAAVVPELLALTAEQPYRERQWAHLMLALHRLGRRAEALATYRRVHHILTTDLGIHPGPELRDLHASILL